MSNGFFKIKKGTNLDPQAGSVVSVEGDIAFNDSSKKLEIHDGSTVDSVVEEAKAATLTNKTINFTNNTITGTGTLSDAGTDGIVVTGGTGSVISNVSLAQHVADATHNGYLSSADWTTFSAAMGTVTSVTFTGDGTVLSNTPSSAVTTTGTVSATLNTQAKNTFLSGPTTGSNAAPTFRAFATTDFIAPTIQRFISGSSTYTTPTSPRVPLYIKVKMVGGGGGGGGSGTSPGTPTTGNSTTFGTSFLTAGGGASGSGTTGGTGGTNTINAGGITIVNVAGGGGGGGTANTNANVEVVTGTGGNSYFGGGAASPALGPGNAGIAGAVNSGGGGSGAGVNGAVNGTAGGGAGGYIETIITSIASTYAYSVAATAAGGTAGGGGSAGGAGAAGIIIVEEYYQ